MFTASVQLAGIVGEENSEFEVTPAKEGREQAVLVFFTGYNHKTLDPLVDLQLRLIDAIEAAGAGEMDGIEIEDNEGNNESGTLFMYGPDADRLYEIVRPTLLDPDFEDFMSEARVLLQYGPAGSNARFKEVSLGE